VKAVDSTRVSGILEVHQLCAATLPYKDPIHPDCGNKITNLLVSDESLYRRRRFPSWLEESVSLSSDSLDATTTDC